MSMLGIYPHTYKKLPYEPVVDFSRCRRRCASTSALPSGRMVPASVKTLAEFIAWCKANPGNANFGSPAPGLCRTSSVNSSAAQQAST